MQLTSASRIAVMSILSMGLPLVVAQEAPKVFSSRSEVVVVARDGDRWKATAGHRTAA